MKVPLVLCSDHTDEAIATFEDANLEEAIRAGPPSSTHVVDRLRRF